jgi:periplasmic divalent cation tolerance protein
MNAEGRGKEVNVRIVLVTAPDVDSAIILVRRVVQERLAACGNVIPGLTSVYRWEGEIQEDPEALIILKSTQDGIERLRRRVEELHPYDVPEFLVLPVSHGSSAYLRWVAAEVGDSEVSG